MEEEWRKFRNSNYSVSNKGNVRNDVTGHPIKPKNTHGYNSFVVHDKSSFRRTPLRSRSSFRIPVIFKGF